MANIADRMNDIKSTMRIIGLGLVVAICFGMSAGPVLSAPEKSPLKPPYSRENFRALLTLDINTIDTSKGANKDGDYVRNRRTFRPAASDATS